MRYTRNYFFHLFPWKNFRKFRKKPFQSEIAKLPEYNGTLEGLLETYLLQATSIQTQCTEKYVLIFSAFVLQTQKKNDKPLDCSRPEAEVYLYRIINHGGQRIVSILEAILCCYSRNSMMHHSNRFNNSSEDATNAVYRDEYVFIPWAWWIRR